VDLDEIRKENVKMLFCFTQMLQRSSFFVLFATVALTVLGMPAIGFQVPSSWGGEWTTADAPKFSFDYPASFEIRKDDGEDGSTMITAKESGSVRGVMVLFLPGLENKPNTFSQCATADDVLTMYYRKVFEPMDTGTNQYPYTKVSHDAFVPGKKGGESTTISITHVEAYQNPQTIQVYLNVVPRKGGFYVVSFSHPSDSWQVGETARRKFLDSIAFKAPPLPANGYCNYLGQ
jgi:hypothetical protein